MAEKYNPEIQFDGEKLKKEIKQRGLTGEGVSSMILGRSASFLSNKMSQGSIKPGDLKKICDFLGLKTEDFEITKAMTAQTEAQELDNAALYNIVRATGLTIDHHAGELKEGLDGFHNDMVEWIDKFLFRPICEISNSMSKHKEILEEIANLLTTIKSQEVIQTNLLKDLINKQG